MNFSYADAPDQHRIKSSDPAALANSYIAYADHIANQVARST